MNAIIKVVGSGMMLFLLSGCATVPPTPPKMFSDQAKWSETTRDQVFAACMTALTMERFSVHPAGTNKDSGLIVTKPREFPFQPAGMWAETVTPYYTLQIAVAETQDKKILVTANAVDTGYQWTGSSAPAKDEMKLYINNQVADDFEKFFARLEEILGKAESFNKDQVLFKDLLPE